jgi:hypothetical protein
MLAGAAAISSGGTDLKADELNGSPTKGRRTSHHSPMADSEIKARVGEEGRLIEAPGRAFTRSSHGQRSRETQLIIRSSTRPIIACAAPPPRRSPSVRNAGRDAAKPGALAGKNSLQRSPTPATSRRHRTGCSTSTTAPRSDRGAQRVPPQSPTGCSTSTVTFDPEQLRWCRVRASSPSPVSEERGVHNRRDH